MFDPYREIFQERGDLYNRATRLAPEARAEERDALIDRLSLDEGLSVCDVPAGGGYLADGIAARYGDRIELVCIEPSPVFAADLASDYRRVVGSMERLPLADGCVDRLGSLAGMHHLPDRPAFLAEAVRVLRPGGRLVLADVAVDTDPARFLNGPVDQLCSTGHDGDFLRPGEVGDGLRALSLIDVEESYIPLRWRFADRETMVAFCRDLFGLTQGTLADVDEAIASHLEVDVEDGVSMAWGLRYICGRKPG